MPIGKEESPEKQLLRLIEESKKEPNLVSKAKVSRQKRGLFSFDVWQARLLFLKEKIFQKKRDFSFAQGFEIKWVNSILEFSLFFLGFYLVSSVFYAFNNLKKIPIINPSVAQTTFKQIDFLEGSILKKSSSYYVEKVGQRDIFNIEQKKSTSTTVVRQVTEATQEAVKNLKLVGISWSENPDAMIEDSRAMRTFFVKRGQMLGEFKVKAIYKDRVILEYNNEEIELK
jgi:type II secretory pathway component PulC